MDVLRAILNQGVVDSKYMIVCVLFSLCILYMIKEVFWLCNYYTEFLFKKYNRKERRTFYKKHGVEDMSFQGTLLLLLPDADKYYDRNKPRRKRFLFFMWTARVVWLGEIIYIIISIIAIIYCLFTDLPNYRSLLLLCVNFYISIVVIPAFLTILFLIPFGVIQEFFLNGPNKNYTPYWKD